MTTAHITMPQLGESVTEGTVVRWLKGVGETVAVDEPLLEIATDKVSMEIPSLQAGVLSEILVPAGSTVPVRTELARIAPASSNGTGIIGSVPRSRLYSPVVRRLSREHDVDLQAISGSGRNGRITRADILRHITERPVAGPAAGNPIRARVAEHVTTAKLNVPDVLSIVEVDMERVHSARVAARGQAEPQKLTYLPFIARAVAQALRRFPAVNARLDGATLRFNEAVHFGIAVDLDEQGLVVPVVRNADDLTVRGLARAISSVSAAARASSLLPADYAGSTFTITNNGSYGSLITAPIINVPNVATLSTDAVEERVVAYQGMIAIRRRMYLCMSWDHRAFDGSTAAKFLAHVKQQLETVDWAAQI